MLWRTIVLSSVNAVTMLMVFVPIVEITTVGEEDNLFLHSSSPPVLFLIQLALGIFAVVIDMFNKRQHLQAKLLATGVALSASLFAVTLWMVSDCDHIGCFPLEYEVRAGVFLPLLNLIIFGVVWYDQRWKISRKKAD